MPRRIAWTVVLTLLAGVLMPSAFADGPYQIGSGNTVTADPTIPRPTTKPCVVQLFNRAEFYDFNVEDFTYTPPADCPGPWAKVILVSDISLNPGIQYDRTANYWLGPVNIFFGTTAEPSPGLGPYWHVESDLTDYSSIFYTAQSGVADIGNTNQCCGLTSTIFATASIEFYPLAQGQSAPVTADVVYALSAGPSGGTVALNTGADQLTGTFTMPTNIEAAYLDVYSQSQSDDEFWYTCVPNNVTGELESCGNTGFRETEVSIDGQPAGVAPISPWIFTGGIDPYLWFPIPGVQTLNFTPYRVNLTPFAGILSNGQQHTVALSVYNADSYFSATASLLLYLDAGSTQVSGTITQDTLTPPKQVVGEKLDVTSTSITGPVIVKSDRNFTISGYVNTSKGKITTTVAQNVSFENSQNFNINDTVYRQQIALSSSVGSTVTTSGGGSPTTVTTQAYSFPLNLDIAELVLSNGDINVTTTVSQDYGLEVNTAQNGTTTYTSSLSNDAQHQDTLLLSSSFSILSNSGQSAGQQYQYSDSTGNSYACDLTAAANVLTSFSAGCSQ
jgi:Peptide N-acetyl-beta-D-glucosaminyl asparaginase amidase A